MLRMSAKDLATLKSRQTASGGDVKSASTGPRKAATRKRIPRLEITETADRLKKEVIFEIPLSPKPKKRPRTSVIMPALINAFRQSHGREETFTRLLTHKKSGGDRQSALMQTFTPSDTYRYERSIARAVAALMAQYSRDPFMVPVEVDLVFGFEGDSGFWPTAADDGDIDNLNKAVFDALNEIAYTDDRLVVASRQVKVCTSRPVLLIRIRPACKATLPDFVQRFIENGNLTLGTGMLAS